MTISTLNINTSRIKEFLKKLMPPVVWSTFYKLLVVKNIPDAEMYGLHFSPWLGSDFLKKYNSIAHRTGLRPQSIYSLLYFLDYTRNIVGDVAECGVWRGGSARLIAEALAQDSSERSLYLFDSFAGMVAVNDSHDRHRIGDFRDTSFESVHAFVIKSKIDANRIHLRKGWMPDTFVGLEEKKFSFVHIDLDLYQSIKDALEFFFPRMVAHGVIVFDDYGYASCPGARRAVDEFFCNKFDKPFILATGQAIVITKT